MRTGLIAILMAAVLCSTPAMAQRGRRGGGGGPGGGIVAAPMPVLVTIHGTLKQLDKKSIVLEGVDGRMYMLRRSKKTTFLEKEQKIQAKDIDIESQVTVEMMEDHDLKLTAVTLRLDSLPENNVPKSRPAKTQ